MAAAEVIKRLSSRATAAEQMIQILRKQVEEIRSNQGSGNYSQEIQKLKRENAQLKSQVDEWKGKLIATEKAAGITQVESSVKATKAASPPKVYCFSRLLYG